MKTKILMAMLALVGLSAMAQENDTVSVQVNDSTALVEQSDSVKKNVRVLWVNAEVRDHLTHDIIKGLKGVKLNAADSTFVDSIYGGYYDENGYKSSYISCDIMKPGKYLIKVEAEGYQTAYVPLDIKKLYKRESNRSIKPIYLKRMPKRNEVELGEVVVKATKLKFYMNGDTLVYNADAFNLAEGSMLNELVKKLPGVTMEKGGVINVNGKPIDTMLLNGKDFFNSDRELLLENMPAYMVKHVTSYERVPDNVKGKPEEKSAKKLLVMDVRLKKEYARGWIANAEGGGGLTFHRNEQGKHDGKFLGRLFGMRFDDHSRLVLFANANNLNDYRTPGEKGEWTPLQQSEGLRTTYKLGGNYMKEREERYRYQGSMETTYSETEDRQNSNSATFLEGGDTYGRSFNTRKSYGWDINTRHYLNLQHDEPIGDFIKGLYVYVQPSVNYQKWNHLGDNANTTLSEDVASQLGKAWMDSIMAPDAGGLLRKYAINRTRSSSKNQGHSTNTYFDSDLNFRPAHNDYIRFRLNLSHNYSDYLSKDYDHYLLDYPSSTTMPADFRNRYTPMKNREQTLNVSPGVTFGLDKKRQFDLIVSYNFNYNDQKSNNPLYLLNKLEGWDKADSHALGTLPSVDEMLSTLDADNSSNDKTTRTTHEPSIALTKTFWGHVKDKDGKEIEDESWYAYLNARFRMPFAHERMDYQRGTQLDTLMTRNTALFRMDVTGYYSLFKRGRSIDFNYRLESSAPMMTSLLNIRDDSNPLYVTLGNPNMKNTHRHSFYGSYRDKFGKTMFNANANVSIVQNAEAMGYIYNKETGVRTVTPDNVDGNWNMNAGSGIDFPLTKNDKWRVKENANYSYNHSVDLNGTNETLVATRSVVRTHNVTEDLSLTWRPTDKMEFGAGGKLTYQHSTSDREYFTNINAFTFQYGVTGQIDLPWNMQVGTDVTMYSRRGYSEASMNTNELVWNARISKRLPKQNLTILFDGFDLLGNLSNVRRYVNAQGRTEAFYNVIPSYGLLHVIYRFNKEPKKK